MSIDKQAYSDLQEITFWQELNKQVIEFREAGAILTADDQKKFQRFCIENRLFHRITEDPLIDDIPLSLITDFNEIQFLTHGLQKWCEVITPLFRNAISLDIEKALAEAFDEMTRLESEHSLSEEIVESDDTELFAVMDQYNGLLEKYGRDFEKLSRNLYTFKTDSLAKIADFSSGADRLVGKSNQLVLDFGNAKGRAEMLAGYFDSFCKPAMAELGTKISAVVVFEDMELVGFFNEIETRYENNHSVLEFIKHERAIISATNEIIRDFSNRLSARLAQTQLFSISICDTDVFSFLKFPLPAV